MPSYDFECQKCGKRFSEVISIAEYEKRQKRGFRCPKCKSRRLEQLVTSVQVDTSRKS